VICFGKLVLKSKEPMQISKKPTASNLKKHMKPKSILTALTAALLAPGALFAQTTATTTPVGYITHTVAGAGAAASADTYVAPTLIQAAEFAGQSTVSPSGGSVVTFASGVPTNLNGSYVLEITAGDKEGWWSTIESSTSTSITLADPLPDNLPANVSVSVRKHSTLENFLGFNSIGLGTFNGADASDEVQVFNPSTQTAQPFAFVTAEDWGDTQNYPNGVWLNLESGEPENNKIISPGSSVRIKRIAADPVTFVSTGAVKTTKTEVDVYEGVNFLGSTIAASGTLGSANFASQLNQWDGSSAEYDEIQILAIDQSVVPFASIDDGGPVIWNISLSDYGTSQEFAGGTGLVLKRVGNPASTIVISGTTVSQ
jgi:hypothetical protein